MKTACIMVFVGLVISHLSILVLGGLFGYSFQLVELLLKYEELLKKLSGWKADKTEPRAFDSDSDFVTAVVGDVEAQKAKDRTMNEAAALLQKLQNFSMGWNPVVCLLIIVLYADLVFVMSQYIRLSKQQAVYIELE